MVSGTRFIGKKNTRTMIIKKISPITDPMDPGSGKKSFWIQIPDQGGKKHRIPDPQHCMKLFFTSDPSC
jgi:hypothetical protein